MSLLTQKRWKSAGQRWMDFLPKIYAALCKININDKRIETVMSLLLDEKGHILLSYITVAETLFLGTFAGMFTDLLVIGIVAYLLNVSFPITYQECPQCVPYRCLLRCRLCPVLSCEYNVSSCAQRALCWAHDVCIEGTAHTTSTVSVRAAAAAAKWHR